VGILIDISLLGVSGGTKSLRVLASLILA